MRNISKNSRVLLVAAVMIASTVVVSFPYLRVGALLIQPEGPFVSEPVTPVAVIVDLSNLTVPDPWKPGDPYFEVPQAEPTLESQTEPAQALPEPAQTASQVSACSNGLSDPIVSFDGIPATGNYPPDPVGDVGPNHYVQMVNSRFAIFDKTGTILAGPSNFRDIPGWSNPVATGLLRICDPIVLYDSLADRWLLTEFTYDRDAAGFYYQCLAISQTSNPVTGGWFLYEFPLSVVPDYEKLGVWPDAYYMSTYEWLDLGVFAFDRASMLSGNPATVIKFAIPSLTADGRTNTRLLPSDLDGSTLPPLGAPNIFVRSVDGAIQGGGADRLEIFEFHVDFANPAASTFTGPTTLPAAAYDIQMGGPAMPRNCIPQPGTTQGLDPLANRLMWRLQYRNSASHETLVVCQTVDVGDFDDHAGMRWYELRRVAGVWSIFQQATYSPDVTHRWMGSAAMDEDGNIALGYSVSDGTVFPGIRYAGRLASDPLRTLPHGEITAVTGGGSQTASARWGDYSAMSVDPVDDHTFWFTAEYYAATSAVGWRTCIVAFRIEVHDVSADSQTHPNAQVLQGSVEPITVVVSNNGNTPETFDVTVYYDSNVIGTQTVTNLAPFSSTTLTFNWDTTGVPPATYAITAWADSAMAIAELDEENNWCTDSTTISIIYPVYVDIKPGSWPNPLGLKSRGVLPVAICGTEDFDVATIDPETIRLTLNGVGVAPLRWSYEDVATMYIGELCSGHDLDGDGYLDLTLKFKTQEVIQTLGLGAFSDRDVVILALAGNLKAEHGGTLIRGQDCVVILKSR